MKIQSLIKFLLAEQKDFATNATPEMPFGKYLFGSDRGKPSRKNREFDTDEEASLSSDLYSHYHGDMAELTPWIPKLVDLEKQGKYTDVLSVPDKYPYAYRMMNGMKRVNLIKILGHMPKGKEPGVMHVENDGLFSPLPGRPHYSWTVDPKQFKKMYDDWSGFSSFSNIQPDTYLVFLRAPIKGNQFLLNPSETAPMADEYAYQKEVISVGKVKCDRVWYIPYDVENTHGHTTADKLGYTQVAKDKGAAVTKKKQ